MKRLLSPRVVIQIAFAILTLGSCKDDETMLSPQETLLVSHPWKFSSMVYETTDTLILNMATVWSTVLQGHKLSFFKNNTYTSSIEPNFIGNWELSADGKTLKLKDGDTEEVITIKVLDGDLLVMTQYDDYFEVDMSLFYNKAE